MRIAVTNVPAAEIETEALILGIAEDTSRPTPWEAVDAALGGEISAVLERPGFRGRVAAVYALSTRGVNARDILLVGLGPSSRIDLEGWRRAVASGVKAARDRGCRRAAVPVPELPGLDAGPAAVAAAEVGHLATYRFQEYKPPSEDQTDLEELVIATSDESAADAVARAEVVCDAVCWTRDLVNRPGNAKRTEVLAELAMDMADEHGLRAKLLDTDRCRELGMNALLAVGAGSDASPRLVVLEHRPGDADEKPVLLVGKGITFDSGGISIKPSKGMGDMKGDMAGAAAVFGTLRAAADLGLPRHIVGVTPLAENLLSGASYRPGDIVRAYSGTTIEVANTDAEGRLVLADALAWAIETYEPTCVVDLATLTGACVIALGTVAAGLMSNDDELADELLEASRATGERLWRLPLWEDYDEQIDTEVAHVKNTGGREAGAITAAKFLQRFVGDSRWAHLDIAGPALISKAKPYQPKGATGFGVRLLTEWLRA